MNNDEEAKYDSDETRPENEALDDGAAAYDSGKTLFDGGTEAPVKSAWLFDADTFALEMPDGSALLCLIDWEYEDVQSV